MSKETGEIIHRCGSYQPIGYGAMPVRDEMIIIECSLCGRRFAKIGKGRLESELKIDKLNDKTKFPFILAIKAYCDECIKNGHVKDIKEADEIIQIIFKGKE